MDDSRGVTASLPHRPLPEEVSQPASQAQLLQSRYELVYLVFQFLISLAVLIGVFLLIVVFQQGTVASGGIALSTLVVSYWLGLNVKRHLS
jgi:hypothetical protein